MGTQFLRHLLDKQPLSIEKNRKQLLKETVEIRFFNSNMTRIALQLSVLVLFLGVVHIEGKGKGNGRWALEKRITVLERLVEGTLCMDFNENKCLKPVEEQKFIQELRHLCTKDCNEDDIDLLVPEAEAK